MTTRHVSEQAEGSSERTSRLSRSVQLVLISSTLLTGCQESAPAPRHVAPFPRSNTVPGAGVASNRPVTAVDCSQPDPANPDKQPCEVIVNGEHVDGTHSTTHHSHITHHHTGGYSPLSPLVPFAAGRLSRSGLMSGSSHTTSAPAHTTAPHTTPHTSSSTPHAHSPSTSSHVTSHSTPSHTSSSHSSTSHVSSSSRGGFGGSAHSHSSSS